MYRQSEKKLVKQQYLPHMSPQYGELRPTSSWDCFGSLGHPSYFQRLPHLGSVTARHVVVGVSQTLRRWTEGATYVWHGDHHVGHWPTFLVRLVMIIPFPHSTINTRPPWKSEMFPKQSSWFGMEKLNLTQQEYAFTNQKKCTTTQNKHKKLKPGLVTSYDIQPGNGEDLFLFRCFVSLSLTYLRHLPTYSLVTHIGQSN